ncbi:MAG: Cof-type HAD-IIB family hydrolase [bacterium]
MSSSTSAGKRVALLLADVDGTLVTRDKTLTDRTHEAVRKLGQNGIAFAITSGRPPRGMGSIIGPLDISTPIAGFNGGLFLKPDLTIIAQSLVPPEVAERAIATIRTHGLDVWVYCGTEWYVLDRHGPHVDREEHTVQFPPTVIADFDGVLDRVVKIVGVSDDHEAVARAEKDAQEECGEKASAARSQPYYLDITHPDANKGAVLTRLSEFLGIPAGRIATIGDMPNDVLMFRPSGLSIAMGNASDEVKAAADRVTSSNEEEGFARAVELYVLPAGERDGGDLEPKEGAD